MEKGVRFVQLFDWGWDIHGTGAGDDLLNAFPNKCKQVDQALSVYRAKFSSVSTKTSLPGASTSRLKTVAISVLNTNGSPDRANADLASSKDAKKFTVLIPDNGL